MKNENNEKKDKPSFLIKGEKCEIEPDNFFMVSKKKNHPKGVVITGKVKKGELRRGQLITISSPLKEETIIRKVVTIEVKHGRRGCVAKGEEIGILIEISLRDLQKFNEEILALKARNKTTG